MCGYELCIDCGDAIAPLQGATINRRSRCYSCFSTWYYHFLQEVERRIREEKEGFPSPVSFVPFVGDG